MIDGVAGQCIRCITVWCSWDEGYWCNQSQVSVDWCQVAAAAAAADNAAAATLHWSITSSVLQVMEKEKKNSGIVFWAGLELRGTAERSGRAVRFIWRRSKPILWKPLS